MTVPAIDQIIDTIKEVVENAHRNNHLLLDLSQAIVTKINEMERRLDNIEKRIDQGENILMIHQAKIQEVRVAFDTLRAEGLSRLQSIQEKVDFHFPDEE